MAQKAQKPLTKEVIRKLPKAELHCHLDGSLRISTIIELAQEQSVQIPTFDREELGKLVTVDENCASLVEYLRGFDITLMVLQKPYAITRAVFEVAEDAVNDGIKYLEVRFSPILHTREGLSLTAVMEAVCEGQSMVEYKLPIKLHIIVCGMRQLPPEVTLDLAEIAWRYRHKGVCGFDLAGPELGFSSKHHRKAFALVRRKCLNCTLHSGEAAGWESVQDSIQYCGARRLGHGVRLRENPELVKFIVDHSIAVECCVTSNVHTKAISAMDQHPIREYFDAGVVVVPCTDNPTVSGVTLSGEYELIHKNFNFNVEEIVRMIDYGFSAAFMSATSKRRFRADALKECVEVLSQEGYDITPILENKLYYDFIGVPIREVAQGAPEPYWKTWKNPDITRELCRLLPKTDLHCTFDGSQDLDFIFNALGPDERTFLKANFGIEFTTKDELKQLLQFLPESGSQQIGKRIVKQVLQTKEQIERGLENLFENAQRDSVRYLEIVFRPKTHCLKSLTEEEALKTLLKHLEGLNLKFKGVVHAGVIVYVSTAADDPITFLETAKLAVKYKHQGVCGFGVYGSEEFPYAALKYFLSTFHYLKANNMNVAIFAGASDVDSIISALAEGGAARISGAFAVHKFPRLMAHMSNYSIPVEVSLSAKLQLYTKEVERFAGNPIRMFIDNDLPITLCSFRGVLEQMDRIESLFQVSQQCQLSAAMVFKLLGHGFRYNFQSYAVRKEMFSEFKKKAEDMFGEHGFKFLHHKAYFPLTK